MRDNGIIILILIILGIATFLGGPLGLSFHGQVDKPILETSQSPSLFSIIGWCWNGLSFLFGLALFQVDGVPGWISFIYDILAILIIWISLKWVRGNATGT